MNYKIALVVDGVDLSHEPTLHLIGEKLTHFVWEERSGLTTSSVITEKDPITQAYKAAQLILHEFPAACVQRVDRELVGISEIAREAGVTPEAVRLWVKGTRGPGDFPTPVGAIGAGAKGASKLWFWADVNAWLERHYALGDGYRYLNEREHALLTDRLTRIGQDIGTTAGTMFLDPHSAVRLGSLASYTHISQWLNFENPVDLSANESPKIRGSLHAGRR